MRSLRVLMLLVLLATVVLGACTTPQPAVVKETVIVTVVQQETVVTEKEVVVTATPEPAQEMPKTLILAAHTDILGLDPARVFEIWGSFVLHNTYDTLLTVDAK